MRPRPARKVREVVIDSVDDLNGHRVLQGPSLCRRSPAAEIPQQGLRHARQRNMNPLHHLDAIDATDRSDRPRGESAIPNQRVGHAVIAELLAAEVNGLPRKEARATHKPGRRAGAPAAAKTGTAPDRAQSIGFTHARLWPASRSTWKAAFQPPFRGEQAVIRSSSTARSRAFWVSEAARWNSTRASSSRPSFARRSPRTVGSRW